MVIRYKIQVERTSRSAFSCLFLTSSLPRTVPFFSNNSQLNRQLSFPSTIVSGFFSPTLSQFSKNVHLPFAHYFMTVFFSYIINDIFVVYVSSIFIHSFFPSCLFVSPVHARCTSSSCSAPFYIIRTCRPSCRTLYENSAGAFRLPLSIRSLTYTFMVFSAL